MAQADTLIDIYSKMNEIYQKLCDLEIGTDKIVNVTIPPVLGIALSGTGVLSITKVTGITLTDVDNQPATEEQDRLNAYLDSWISKINYILGRVQA